MQVEDFGGYLGVRDPRRADKLYALDTEAHMLSDNLNVYFLMDGPSKVETQKNKIFLGRPARYVAVGNMLVTMDFGPRIFGASFGENVQVSRKLRAWPKPKAFEVCRSLNLGDRFTPFVMDLTKKQFLKLRDLSVGEATELCKLHAPTSEYVSMLRAVNTEGSIWYGQAKDGSVKWLWDGSAFVK